MRNDKTLKFNNNLYRCDCTLSIKQLHEQIVEWRPPGRRRRRRRRRRKGRSRNSWMQEVTTRMRDMEWVDREEWRIKIKLYALKDVQTSLLSRLHK